jgi:hypothetical protein
LFETKVLFCIFAMLVGTLRLVGYYLDEYFDLGS